ncbi:MAG: phosphodiesterase [Anaerorhabdus sp.]
MMKWMVVGDIHGSISAANKIKEVLSNKEIKGCLLLGDILYHGPRNPILEEYNPKAVVDILNSMKEKVIAVRGNCDSEVDQMVLAFPMMSDMNQLFLQDKKVILTHGHLEGDYSTILEKGDILIQGHTHILKAEKVGDYYLLNAGSLSLPKENNPRTYGILSDKEFVVLDIEDNEIQKILWD